MSGWLLGLLALVAVQAWFVPLAIGRLPEPAAEELPEEGSEEETELHRMLRAEGPKELYTEVAALPWLAPTCVVGSVLLAGAVGHHLGNHPLTWVVGLLTPTLVLLSIVDWRTRLLPRRIVLPATAALIGLALVEWALTQHTAVLVRSLVAMLLARSFFWVLWFVRQAGMGFGDVRLAALVGIVLGRVSWNAWIVGLYGGLLVFSLFALGVLVRRRSRATLKKAYPYGPFMVLGLYLGVLASGAVHVV